MNRPPTPRRGAPLHRRPPLGRAATPARPTPGAHLEPEQVRRFADAEGVGLATAAVLLALGKAHVPRPWSTVLEVLKLAWAIAPARAYGAVFSAAPWVVNVLRGEEPTERAGDCVKFAQRVFLALFRHHRDQRCAAAVLVLALVAKFGEGSAELAQLMPPHVMRLVLALAGDELEPESFDEATRARCLELLRALAAPARLEVSHG